MTTDTDTTTDSKSTITIAMSDRRPIKVDPDEWPVIATAEEHDGKVAAQANTEWYVRVREDINGRRVVYGGKVAGPGGQHRGFRPVRAGYLVENVRREGTPMREDRNGQMTAAWPNDDETIRAIRRVAGAIERADLGAECIADMPAEVL